jgi:hypothetical protein
MALVPLSPLTSAPTAIRPAAGVSFAITLMDPMASPGQTFNHALTLRLDPGNGLFFAGGAKSVTRTKAIGSSTPVSLPETIQGADSAHTQFDVTIIDPTGTPLGSVLVSLL